MKKLLSIVLVMASIAVYASDPRTCDDYKKVDILCTGGTISAMQDLENHCNWTLTANPAAGYRFAYWTDLYGIKYYETSVEDSIDTEHQNSLWQATFVRDNARIFEWTTDNIVYRADTTDLLSGSASAGTVNISIDGAGFEDDDPSVTYADFGIWNKSTGNIGDNNTYAGKPMHMVIYNSCGLPSAVIDTIVPVMVSGGNVDASTLNFHSTEAHTTDVQVFDTLIIDKNTTIHGVLDIHAGAKVVVPSGVTLTVDSIIIMRGNGLTKKWPQLAVDGAVLTKNEQAVTIYYDYTLDQHNYYPLALPFDVKCEDVYNPINNKAASYQSYIYNSASREKEIYAWDEFNDLIEEKFDAGKGYIVYAVPTKWRNVKAKRQQQAIMRFPMVGADLSEGENEKIISTYTNNSEEAKSIRSSLRNWNCIGNPYLANITMGYNSYPYNIPGTVTAHQGEGDKDSFSEAPWGTRSPRYFTFSNDGFRTYQQGSFNEFVLLPFNSYFTQTSYGDKIKFAKIYAAAAPKRVAAEEGDEMDELTTGILLSQGEQSDRINLLFNDYFTYDYELNADLTKAFGSAQPLSAYSLMNDATPLAYQALPMEAMNRPIALGYRKADMSPMTFSFDDSRYDRSLLDALWLTDQVTGKVTDLLFEDYTFMPEATQDDNRFFLSLEKRKVVDVTTAVDEINQERTITHIYDMLGREINTSYNMLPQGVYVITDNLGTTRKEIIR